MDSEVRHREGMPYGGMPHDALLRKLEETDPELVDEVRGLDEFHDVEDDYGDYARREVVDWGPDAPFLESDQTRRDPALSRSALNLRYNGTRGSNPELPRHPELFYGFTGNDPRGAAADPRFDQMRGHMTARAAGLACRMGDNDDHHLAERPWTGQSISYAMKEVQRRQKANARVFAVQKEGRPWGHNVAADVHAAGDVRAAAMGAGDESLPYQPGRFAAGDHGPANEAWTAGVRGVDAGRFAFGPEGRGAEVAPWRHTTGDADLGVQQYGQKRGAGRGAIASGAQGGGRLNACGADQDWFESKRAQSTNRQALAATMAVAARHRRAVKSGAHDQALAEGYESGAPAGGLAPARDPALLYRHIVEGQGWRPAASGYEPAGAPAGGLAPARDPALLHRHSVEGQGRRPAAEVQDGDGGVLGTAAGLTPAANPERAIRSSAAQATANAHLTNVASIVSGLREGSAAGRRRIAGAVVADGARGLAPSEAEAGSRRGAIPGTDLGRTARLAEMPLTRPAAAEGLTVHVYRSAPPPVPERRAAAAQGAYDSATWRPQYEPPPLGLSKTPGEWRSQTQAQTTIGDAPDRVFGFDASASGYQGGAPVGPKTLRAGAASDSTNLTDLVGGFSDGVDTSA